MADTAAAPKTKRAPKRKGNKAAKAAKKAANDAAHYSVLLKAAHLAVDILTREGISCAIFGSLASRLYGAPRCPKDVDLLIYQAPTQEVWTAERLKKLILDKDPVHFYLTLPRDPEATYRILWYRQEYVGAGCKVDVLTPGTMHLPNLEPGLVEVVQGVPVVPFGLLLVHKLQGWDDHGLAEEAHKRRKQPQDAADVRRLLVMEEECVVVGGKEVWSDRRMFSEEFEEVTKRRVMDYCKAFPKLVGRWRDLGFEVPDAVQKSKSKSILNNVVAVDDEDEDEEW